MQKWVATAACSYPVLNTHSGYGGYPYPIPAKPNKYYDSTRTVWYGTSPRALDLIYYRMSFLPTQHLGCILSLPDQMQTSKTTGRLAAHHHYHVHPTSSVGTIAVSGGYWEPPWPSPRPSHTHAGGHPGITAVPAAVRDACVGLCRLNLNNLPGCFCHGQYDVATAGGTDVRLLLIAIEI